MARKRRYQPENVCYHVVTRVAHREFLFNDEEKRLIVEMICRVAELSALDRYEMTVEAFPNGYKSPSTAFSCGDTKLMTLRRLEALR